MKSATNNYQSATTYTSFINNWIFTFSSNLLWKFAVLFAFVSLKSSFCLLKNVKARCGYWFNKGSSKNDVTLILRLELNPTSYVLRGHLNNTWHSRRARSPKSHMNFFKLSLGNQNVQIEKKSYFKTPSEVGK